MTPPSLLGQVSFFNLRRGFGRIRSDEQREGIFVHFSTIEGEARALVPHELVRFDFREGPRGPRATRVRRLSTRLQGNVVTLRGRHGELTALPGGQRFTFDTSDLLSESPEPLTPGVAVEFSPFDAETAKELVVTDPRPPLSRFAALPSWQAQLAHLQRSLLPEPWHLLGPGQRSALDVYLHHTFARLQQENKIEQGRTPDGEPVAVFHTGLLDQTYREVLALLEPNPQGEFGEGYLARPPWQLSGFVDSSHPSLQELEHLPSPAYYHDEPDELLFDPALPVEVPWAYLLHDASQAPVSTAHLHRCLNLANRLACFDLFRVRPAYYGGEMVLMLPLALSPPAPTTLVAVLARQAHRYLVIDLLSLAEAYPLTRLLGPIPAWWYEAPHPTESYRRPSSPMDPRANGRVQ